MKAVSWSPTGLREDLQGRASGAVRSFALYGETAGETDEFGLPIRYNWATEYRGPRSDESLRRRSSVAPSRFRSLEALTFRGETAFAGSA